ncbi:MAG: FAD-binding oxidoreductase [Planctomycetota bacterium]
MGKAVAKTNAGQVEANASGAGASGAALLPLTRTVTPTEVAEVAATLADCYASATPVYAWGGQTSLDRALPAKRSGIGLALTGLNRISDYPARDLTITVEAGLTWRALQDRLATENQQLPIDVPQAERATVGGVIATNYNGPRRYGCGTVRDHVIGIQAVDGRGTPFKGGGRVVKNVAGYDFCKLLTGSLGTLGVITAVTLRLKPRTASSAFVGCVVTSDEQAEALLASISRSETTPVAVELLSGPAWQETLQELGARPTDRLLVVGLEGTLREVDWMVGRLRTEWQSVTSREVVDWRDTLAQAWWSRLTEFPQAGDSPLVIKASVRPSGTVPMMAAIERLDPGASLQAHAGNGIVIARLSQIPAGGLSRTLVGQLQPVAAAQAGHITVWSNPGAVEATHQSVWGGMGLSFDLMTAVKRQFDPLDLLNPGRFVYVE